MRLPAISARAHIYATECKRRAPRLTVLPHGMRHPHLQRVARTGVRLRAPSRRKPVNNARVAGAGGAQALSHSLGGGGHSPCHGIQRCCCGHCPGPWRLSSRRQLRAATAPPRQRATCAATSAHARRFGPETTATAADLLGSSCPVCVINAASRARVELSAFRTPSSSRLSAPSSRSRAACAAAAAAASAPAAASARRCCSRCCFSCCTAPIHRLKTKPFKKPIALP